MRSERVLTAIAVAIPVLAATVVAGWTYSDFRYTGWFTDALDYLWFADFYQQSFGGTVTPEAEATFRSTRFPPLLPLLLAVVGAGSMNLAPSALLMFVLFVACAGLAASWVMRETGNRLAAILVGLLLALSPGWFLIQQMAPVAEPLMLLMVLVGLLLGGKGPLTRSRALTLALVAGAVPLARSIGIAFAIPVAIRLLAARELGRIRFALAALTLLPFAAWSAFRATLPEAERYSDSLTLEQIRLTFGGVDLWLLGQPLRMVEGAAGAFALAADRPAVVLASVIAVLCLVGISRHWRRLDAQFVLLYLGIVLVWPFPAEAMRFMVPLLPLVLLIAARGAGSLAATIGSKTALAPGKLLAALAFVGLAIATPTIVRTGSLAVRAVEPDLAPFKRTAGYLLARSEQRADSALEFNARLIAALSVLPDYVEPGNCVYSLVPQMVVRYGGVPSLPVPRNLQTAEEALAALRSCRYLLAISAPTQQHGEAGLYPATLFGRSINPLFQSMMTIDAGPQPAVALFRLH